MTENTEGESAIPIPNWILVTSFAGIGTLLLFSELGVPVQVAAVSVILYSWSIAALDGSNIPTPYVGTWIALVATVLFITPEQFGTRGFVVGVGKALLVTAITGIVSGRVKRRWRNR